MVQNSQKSICVRESLFNKIAGLKVSNFVKKKLQHRFIPVNIARFLTTAFSQNTCRGCFCIIGTMCSPYSKQQSCIIQHRQLAMLAKYFFDQFISYQINCLLIQTIFYLKLPLFNFNYSLRIFVPYSKYPTLYSNVFCSRCPT